MRSSHPFALAPVALMLMLALPPAHGLTLGELRLHSYLGQSLRATVALRLAPGEDLPEQRCLQLLQTEDALPLPTRPLLRLREKEKILEIQSLEVVNEPLLGFVLAVGCDSRGYMRRYTAFIDPEPTAPLAGTVPPPALATVKPLPPPVSRAQPAPAVKPWPRSLVADREATASELAADVYPAGSARHRRLTRTLIAANPALAQPDATVPAGTKLRTRIPAPPKPKPQPAPKPLAEDGDRLTLIAEDIGAVARRASAPQTREDQVRALQEKMGTLQDLQLKLDAEIKSLNHTLAQLEKAAAPAASAPVALPASQPAAVVASTASPVAVAPLPAVVASSPAATSPAPPKERLLGLPFWFWLGSGLLSVAGLSFWLGRRARLASGYAVRQGGIIAPGVGANTFNTRFGIARESATEMSLFRRNAAGGIDVNENTSDIDRAQFLLAEGEDEEAIGLLYKSIDDNELDVERWLILFHIFRERMMRTEYEQLAQRFQKLAPEAEDWELVRNIGRKIDPNNPLYAPTVADTAPRQPAPPPTGKDGDPLLDFLHKPAAPPPPRLDLEPPPLIPTESPPAPNPAQPNLAQPELILPPEALPPDAAEPAPKPVDDFEKPCRY